jgi:hypothetical protein
LFRNRGGRFTDVSAEWQVAIDSRYDTCAPVDVDHDGRLDVYVNGTVTGGTSYRDHLFRNTGSRYEEATPVNIGALQADHGAQWADFDGDGDPDLALTGAGAEGVPLLLRNMLAPEVARRSLHVRVLDHAGRATRAGAEVRLYTRGTQRLLAARLVDSGSGYDAQNDVPVHFGLAATDAVDVQVTFPAAGRRQVAWARNVTPGKTATVVIRTPK